MAEMRGTFVITGRWWTPSNPNKTVTGAMTFDPSKGAILELGGLLKENEVCPMPFEIVLGETEEGKEITLVGSSGTWLGHAYSVADNGEHDVPTCSSMCANVLLIGKHCPSTKGIRFHGLMIELTHLSEWVRASQKEGDNQFSQDSVMLEYDIGTSGKVTIESDIEGSCFLTLALKDEVDLDQGIELVRRLRNLMSLLMHRPIQEILIRGFLGTGENERGPGLMVDIFYPSFAHDNNASPLEFDDMLLPFKRTRTELGDIVARWFSANESLPQVLDLYFAASQGIELFIETRFLMYVQAIEAYHRIRYRNFEVDPGEHTKRLADILSSIPDEYKEWMRNGLEHSNEPSHGQRLKEIYRDVRPIMDEFVEDRKLFIFRVVKTRNYLTHSEGDGMVFEGNDLVLATTRLRLMLELCLLRETGIGPERMKQAVFNNSMFTKIRVRPDGSR
jgi:hypothetical protein